MSGPESVLPPGASSGMRYILIRASRHKMYRPCGMRWEVAPIPALRLRTPCTVLKHVLWLI